MRSTRTHTSPILLLLALLALSCSTQRCMASHSWSNYHWARSSNPVTVKLINALTSDWSPYLTNTANQWSRSSVVKPTVVTASFAIDPSTCPLYSGLVTVCNYKYGATGWIGLAQASVDSSGNGHFLGANVRMNDYYTQYNTPSWRTYIMCQEVGHTFGLAHQDENYSNNNLGSCMDWTNWPSGTSTMPSNLQPNQHDFNQLTTIYRGHYDNTGRRLLKDKAQGTVKDGKSDLDEGGVEDLEIDPTPVTHNPKTWGKQVARKGKHAGFVKRTGKDRYLLTDVILADENAVLVAQAI